MNYGRGYALGSTHHLPTPTRVDNVSYARVDAFSDLLWVPLDPLVSSDSVVINSRSEAVLPVSCLCILMLLLGVLLALLIGNPPDSLNVRAGISLLWERDL